MKKSNSKLNLIILSLMILCEIIVYGYFDNIFLVIYVGCIFTIFYIVFSLQKSNVMSPLICFMGLYLFFVGLGPIGYCFNRNTVRQDISVLILMGLLVFVIGYFCSRDAFKLKKRSTLFDLNYNNNHTIKIIATMLLLISLIIQIYFIVANRGLLFSDVMSSGRIEAIAGNGLVIYISGLWSFAACLLIELHLKETRIELYIWLMIVVSAILSLAKGFKSALLNFVLIVLIMYNKKKKISARTIFLYLIVALLFIILYNAARDGIIIGTVGEVIFSAICDESYVGYINLEYVINCFPARHDYMHGYGYLINIIMLGPGEDLDFTLTLKQILGLEFSGGGVTPTILGEFYLNFGYIGCILGMFILGIIYRNITKFLNRSESYFFPVWLVITVCTSIRTGLANAEVSLLLNTFIYICICWFSQRYRLKTK